MWTLARCSPVDGRWTPGGRWYGLRTAIRTRPWLRPPNGSRCGPTGTGMSPSWTRTPWGWRVGGWAPDGPARRIRSAPGGVILRAVDRVRAGDVLYELRADGAGRIPAALDGRRHCGSATRRRRHSRWCWTGSRRSLRASQGSERRRPRGTTKRRAVWDGELVEEADPDPGTRQEGHRRVRPGGQQREARGVGSHGRARRLDRTGAQPSFDRYTLVLRAACGSEFWRRRVRRPGQAKP
jgi:hypothetical protein